MTRTALVSGGWGQNIGNAFFNLGGRHVLEAAGNEVQLIQDSPAYWTFRNQARGAYSNAFDLICQLDCSLLVLQGPVFTRHFGTIWSRRLRELRKLGTAWGVLSGAFRQYNRLEQDVVASVLRDVPPEFIYTRDSLSAKLLHDLGFAGAQVGIDSAFFAPEFAPAARLRPGQPPIVTFCFDHFAEPQLVETDRGLINIGGRSYAPVYSKQAEAAARRGKAWAYLYELFDRRALRDKLGCHVVVRPEHRTNPHLPHKIYRRRNAIASDEPWSYLALYSTTSLTLSDRVHACVVTLAYGRPAMLHNPTTRRSELFGAVGAGQVRERPVILDRSELAERRSALVESVRKRTGGLGSREGVGRWT